MTTEHANYQSGFTIVSEDITKKAAILEVLNKSLMEDIKDMLDAIHWDAFAEDDTTLEIDRAVAGRIRTLHYNTHQFFMGDK
jgi:hypothetical protein